MRNLTIAVAVTALIAFPLGYLARWAVEPAPSVPNNNETLAVPEHADDPAARAQAKVRAEPNDAIVPLTASLEREEVLTTTRSSPRASYIKYKRDRLGDFFLINGIGAERAEQIIQELIDADHYIVQKQDAMLDRHTAENAELIAQGGVVRISRTAEEKAELKAEQETRYRQIFGEYYEAYEEYDRSYSQRRVVTTFSSRLPEPLDSAVKETLVRIMYDEHSRLESEPESESAGSGAHLTSTPQGWEAEKEKYYKRLLERRSFYERVLDRTKAYLTPSQFEQFKGLLDNDLRRFELLIELAEVDE